MTDLVTNFSLSGNGSRFGRVLHALQSVWNSCIRRRREIEGAAELMSFSDQWLADIGISRCEIEGRVRFSETLATRSGD